MEKVLSFQNSNRRRGSGMVIFALALTSLIGFTALSVDYGFLVMDANRLQRAADAAALAGATKLVRTGTSDTAKAYDKASALALAYNVAKQNGISNIAVSDITFPEGSYNKIRVTPRYTRKHFFAGMIGRSSSGLSRSSLAGRLAVTGIKGAVPLAMTVDDFNARKDATEPFTYDLIRMNKDDFKAGTLAALDLRPDNNGKSPNVFGDDLRDGYDGVINIGDDINALNAAENAQGKQLEDAMADRFSDAANASYADTGTNYTFPNYPTNSRRIMYLIVAPPAPADNNKPTIEALFFVPVYVHSTSTGGSKDVKLTMRILPWYSQDPNAVLTDIANPTVENSVTTLIE